MKVSNIELMDVNKKLVCIYKEDDQWVLPAVSAKNLLDLPSVNGGQSTSLNYLLFQVPEISNENERLHLYIEFSMSDSFDNVILYNSQDHKEMFKLFTGLAMEDFPEWGANYIFSNQSLKFDVTNINKSYNYFRYHWVNVDEDNFGAYYYGDRESMQCFAPSNSITISSTTTGNASLNYLLFSIPKITDTSVSYHFSIEFSKQSNFENCQIYTSLSHPELFKVFTGLAVEDFPSWGVNYILSNQSLQLNVANISSDYKYFRYQWIDENGENAGSYCYGNREATQLPAGITATEKITVNGVAPDSENNINFPQYNYIEDGNINVSLSTEVGKSTVEVYSTPLKSLEITHNADLAYDFTIIFSTRDDFQGFSLYLTKDCYVNKELVIEENKRYIICFDKDSILWTELTQYEQ